MNKKCWFILSFVFIISLAILFRCLNIDKPDGLWYDELLVYHEIAQNNIFDVFKYVFKFDMHLPLYMLCLHLWCKLFSFSDISMRMFSAVCGILTVICAYFAGKEFKDKKTGLIAMGVFAISSLLIFYSQEVKPYILQVLASTIFLWSIFNIKRNPKNFKNYIFMALGACFTVNVFSLSVLFVVIQIVILNIYLTKKYVGNVVIYQNIRKSIFVILVLFLPVIIYLFCIRTQFICGSINSFYSDFSIIFVLLQNYFSPILTGLYNNPVNYFQSFNYCYFTFMFIILPIIFGLYYIFKIIKKNEFSRVILLGALGFLFCEVCAVFILDFSILTRFTLVIVPNVLFLVAFGLSDLKKTYFTSFLVSFYLITNISYLTVGFMRSYRIERYGFKRAADCLLPMNLKEKDFLVVWNNPNILDKYLDVNVNKLSLLKNFAYTNEEILNNQEEFNKKNTNEKKEYLKLIIKNNKIPSNMFYLMDVIYSKMDTGNKFIIFISKKYSHDMDLNKIMSDEEIYDKTSLNDLMTKSAFEHLKILCNKTFNYVGTVDLYVYDLLIYKK